MPAEEMLEDHQAEPYALLLRECMEFILTDERDLPFHEYEAIKQGLLERIGALLKQWA